MVCFIIIHCISAFFCVLHNKLLVRDKLPERLTCILFSVCPPSDQRQYEPGAGLCVSAGLLALWQRVGLQTLCLCPHTPHTPHAGGGGGQLVVVCINFLSICTVISVCVLTRVQCVFVYLLVIWRERRLSAFKVHVLLF